MNQRTSLSNIYIHIYNDKQNSIIQTIDRSNCCSIEEQQSAMNKSDPCGPCVPHIFQSAIKRNKRWRKERRRDGSKRDTEN